MHAVSEHGRREKGFGWLFAHSVHAAGREEEKSGERRIKLLERRIIRLIVKFS